MHALWYHIFLSLIFSVAVPVHALLDSFSTPELIWQLNVSLVAQVKKSACCSIAEQGISIYTVVAVYDTIVNSWIKRILSALLLRYTYFFWLSFWAKGGDDLRALTVTVSVCQDMW